MSQVRKEIENLRFVRQHAEIAYLNEERVRDRFTASFGAISTWVARASKGTGGRVGGVLFAVEGLGEIADEVTYDITHPVARAMLLRASVESTHMVRPLDKAKPLDYVLVRGGSCFRHPSLPTTGHSAACEPTEEVERRRANSELSYTFFDPHASVLLLTVQLPEGGRAVATANRKWINDGVFRYFHRTWTTFGVLENRIGDVPLIAPICVFVDSPSDGSDVRQ